MQGGINYGRIMLRAGHRVIADVLGEVAENGLPEQNKLVIKFDTNHPGVDMADWLKERHGPEMVILLDAWFDDLAVMGDRFQVTLNFSDTPQTLVVPFAAILEFSDPGVGWGLAFVGLEPEEASDQEAARIAEQGVSDEDERQETHDEQEHHPAGQDRAGHGADGHGDDEPDGPGGGSVVQLDRFRKG